ncbi:amidohydrolase family protein [Methanocella arvoryzae]|uniref:Amidohydrolase n=1 Tax=Methanocella arvoryzae (strain DSM 22066 / NBRC 105507 / MRE50) TaxID=351160 RepID=Q0W4K0_METAR|nr:amidohydrolase family protein [Methanocella arvoryzae]CAJ36693.1 putative amidohydrolase [Methanocella arvoryzae MRE50]
MPEEYVVSGTLLYGDDFEAREGYLVIRDGKIREVGFDRTQGSIQGIVCPAFINAHTHLGDSVAKDLPYMPLAELVAPPDGLKHRILRETPPETIASGMASALADMAATGTCHCIDFRENGVAGVRLLRDVAGNRATIMGRLAGADSVAEVLQAADGLGLSGANDMPRDLLLSLGASARKAGKLLGIHAGELNATDIPGAMEISPDFIVHMTHATAADIRKTADLGIPVVVCPRSNALTGVGLPPLREMVEAGVQLALGTDNVMLNGPDMFREMEWVSKAFLHNDAYTFRMATLNGARLMGCGGSRGSILPGKDADLIVLRQGSDNLKFSRNLLGTIVRRARPDDIGYTIIGGRIWQNSSRKS